MRRLLFFLLMPGAFITFVLYGCVERIPPRDLTISRIIVFKAQILQFACTHNRLPGNLAEIPKRSGYDDSIQDGWNRDLIYEVDSIGKVTLKSYGKDGVRGGIGDNADIMGVFPSHEPSGKWSDDLVPWLAAP